MPIPESKFDDWKGTGADNGSADARRTIKRILEMDRSPVEQSDGSYEVRLQGSYKNSTHTYGSSDVDIIAKLTSAWGRDLSELNADEKERYHSDHTSPPDYGYSDFQADVWQWLSTKFDGISRGSKAIKIDSDRSSRLSVDVDIVPCCEYRVYHSYPAFGDPNFDSGMYFRTTTGGTRIINYPGIHYGNGCDMHSNYKETVRIFKNARDFYNESWNSWRSIDAPSYFIECLIYNVPERILKRSSRSDRFKEALDYFQADSTDLESFDQVSEMEPLFGENDTQWDKQSAETMLHRLEEMWDDWHSQHNAQLFH